jgi:hypothetical protein
MRLFLRLRYGQEGAFEKVRWDGRENSGVQHMGTG